MPIIQSRRRFLATLSGVGAASLVGGMASHAADGPLETTRVRLPVYYKVSDCQAPEYVSEELLREEGFTDIHFVDSGYNIITMPHPDALKDEGATENGIKNAAQ